MSGPMAGSRDSQQKRRVPERTCAGCRGHAAPSTLLRVVRAPDGSLVADLGQSAFGRGAWVHADPRCIQRAAPRGFSASFRAKVETNAEQLTRALHSAAEHRIKSLVGVARRAGKLVIGSTAVEQASKTADLLLVATDARAAGASWVESAVRSGRAAAWGTKAELGAALGREEVGAIAVLDAGLARALKVALAVKALPAGRGRREDSGAKEVS
jgi:uncharacterized protein